MEKSGRFLRQCRTLVRELAAVAARRLMQMEKLVSLRELSGLSQFIVARKSGVPRVRLSLAETRQLELSPEEEARIRAVLLRAIEMRSRELQAALADSRAETEVSA
jgi:hypothetical protein